MIARTTSGSTVEVLAAGTPVRYIHTDRHTAAERVRFGTITGHVWQGDLFWHYQVDDVEVVYHGSIVSTP
jgi:hypothetical protein